MRWPVRVVASAAVAVGLLALLMVYGGVSPADVLAAFARLPPSVVLLAFGLHLGTYALRALRFRLLLPRACRPGFRRSLVISSAHNMASYLLPAKTGEASLVVYLRMQAGVPTSRGLASLLVARFLDGATLCIALSAACLALRGEPRFAALDWLGTASAALAALATAFLALSVRGDLVVRGVSRLLRWVRLHHWTLGERLLARTGSLAVALRSASGPRLGGSFLLSLPLWGCIFGFYALLSRAMGMPDWVGLPEATFGAALGMLFNLLPLNGAAGMGTQELGWLTGFHKFLGVDPDLALSTGMGVHLLQLFNIVLLGCLAHLAMGVMPRPARRGLGRR